MKLDVRDRCNVSGADYIHAVYKKASELTLIEVDCDVITLGITATILHEKYQSYLNKLDPATAKRVSAAVMEACDNERN